MKDFSLALAVPMLSALSIIVCEASPAAAISVELGDVGGDARVATLSDRGISVTFAAAKWGVGFQARDRWLAML